MVENVLFGNSLGHPASSKEKTKEEGGHVVLVLLLCTGQGVGDRGPTGLGGIYGTCRLLILVRKNISGRRWRRRTTTTTTAKNIGLHEEKSDERGGRERHYGLPQHKERKSLSK